MRYSGISEKQRQKAHKLGATILPPNSVSKPIYWFFLKWSTLGDAKPLPRSISVLIILIREKVERWTSFLPIVWSWGNYLSTILLSTALSSLYTGKIKGSIKDSLSTLGQKSYRKPRCHYFHIHYLSCLNSLVLASLEMKVGHHFLLNNSSRSWNCYSPQANL